GTVGIFQFESSGMKENLAKLQPERLEDLIAMNALYRPGPMEMIDTYIARRHNREKIEYLHESLKPILEETYGIIVYQEQVIRIASEIAGFSLGKADILRRAMSKKKLSEMQKLKAEFIKGATERGMNARIAGEIYDYVERFASYGFNKSHSAGYALVAYQTAYLKAHYPAEFMAAALTSEMGDSDRVVLLVEECRRLNIPIKPPDINRSFAHFKVEDNGIRFGLGAVKNVGLGAILQMVTGREQFGSYHSIYDVSERVDVQRVNRKVLESLIQAGACDELEGHRAQLQAALDDVLRFGQIVRDNKNMGQESLFSLGNAEAQPLSRPELPQMEPWTEAETQKQEKEALGFFLTTHPLNAFRLEVDSFSDFPFNELDKAKDGQSIQVVGYVSEIRRLTDKKGRAMSFATLVDFSGSVEVLFFADAFEKLQSIVQKDAALVVQGRCSTRENEPVKIIAEDAIPLTTARTQLMRGVEIKVNRDQCPENLAEQLERLCTQHPGTTPLIIQMDSNEGEQERRYLVENYQLQIGNHLLHQLEKLVGNGNVRLIYKANHVTQRSTQR
ncbi:MAG: DNA polymerase III subunit alpha, partial [bacterium]